MKALPLIASDETKILELTSETKARDSAEDNAHKMPGHWLLAKLGKRVLRPGGLELTHVMLNRLNIQHRDTVVEFAPGLGVTARLTLSRQPASYTAIERDEKATKEVQGYLQGPRQLCQLGSAEQTGLPDQSATV